jgi:NAD-dependent deacetylase
LRSGNRYLPSYNRLWKAGEFVSCTDSGSHGRTTFYSVDFRFSFQLVTLADYLRRSERILIFTGAGISTSSGIPDFRGPKGVWTRRQPVYFQEFMASEAARIEHWHYKLEGRDAFRAARPNASHEAIVRLEGAGKICAVITQNIDGLHRAAGTSSELLVELHGTNALVECQTCKWRGDPEPHFEYFRTNRRPPLCHCGGFLKPATISFGQSLEPAELARAAQAADEADLVVALGSTLCIYPAASFPLMAASRGAPYIIVNRGATEHDHESLLTLRLEGEVEKIFPEAVDAGLGQGNELLCE